MSEPIPITGSAPPRHADHDYVERQFTHVNESYAGLSAVVATLHKRSLWWPFWRSPRPKRTASGARVNPDRYGFGMVIVALNVAYAMAAFAVSFFGQYEMAKYSPLPPFIWWLLPIAIDLPIVSASFMVAAFRKRKQAVWPSWTVAIIFTLVSSIISVTHTLSINGVFTGTPLTLEVLIVTIVMGLMPWILLVTWENLARLLVKPGRETNDLPAAAPAVRPAPKKRSTK